MKKQIPSNSIFELWLLFGKISHSIFLIRANELRQYDIPARQLDVLHVIKDLGVKATLSEVAKISERQSHVISRQAVMMEKDGLIKRIKNKPKSNQLKLELTQKGINTVKISRQSEAIDDLFSSLTEEEHQQLKSVLDKLSIKLKKHSAI